MSEHSLEAHAMKAGGSLRGSLARAADVLIAAVAVVLPWSTSATAILTVLWVIALVPTLDAAAVRRELLSAAGGLPVLLWCLGAVGMLWADVSWSERAGGLSGFHKLLVIPLLLAQFRRSGQAQWALLGFLASAGALLLVSWGLVLVPGLTWRGRMSPGVPVKDYILQSAIFAVCAFGLLAQATELWRARKPLALACVAAAALFLANIVYVATARTTLVVMSALLLLLGLRTFRWKGAVWACLVGGVLASGVWASSPYLRERVSPALEQVLNHGTGNMLTGVGLRLEYWKQSTALIAEAPLVGHGTGTIPMLFRRDAPPGSHPMLITDNPHNQALTIAIQLGLLGVIVLVAMWISHLALFRAGSLVAWLGLVVVVQNVVGSFFNSHLFDFGHGWLYVLAVGVLGGTVLHSTSPPTRIGHGV